MSTVRWYENPKWDVMDTTKFRVAYSLLVISPFIEMVIGTSQHWAAGFIALALIYVWMVGIFAIMARQTRCRHLAMEREWEEDDDGF